jgi:YD repeat-containing protein
VFKATRVTQSGDIAVIERQLNALSMKVVEKKYSAKPAVDPEVTEFKYDAAGNLLSESGKEGLTTYEYDVLNRLIRTRYPDKTVAEALYTSTGLKYATSDRTPGRTEKEFDAAGDVVEHPK